MNFWQKAFIIRSNYMKVKWTKTVIPFFVNSYSFLPLPPKIKKIKNKKFHNWISSEFIQVYQSIKYWERNSCYRLYDLKTSVFDKIPQRLLEMHKPRHQSDLQYGVMIIIKYEIIMPASSLYMCNSAGLVMLQIEF